MRCVRSTGIALAGALALFVGCDNPTANDTSPAPATTGPVISVSVEGTELSDQATVVFDQLSASRTSSEETIVVHNEGDEALSLTKVEIGGVNGENTTTPSGEGIFHWASAPDTTPLPAGESRNYVIRVAQTTDSTATFSGTLTIESDTTDDGISPFLLNLSGDYFAFPGIPGLP